MRTIALTRIGAPAVAGAFALAVAAALTAQAVAAPSRQTAAAPSRQAAAAGAAAPAPVTVSFGEFFYKPARITVKVGQKVVFRNVGKIAHTVANTNAQGKILSTLIKPRNLDPRQTQVVSFAKPGVVYYLCTFHPSLMKGRIVVTR